MKRKPSKGWCVRWKSAAMKRAVSWYYTKHVEALDAANQLMRRRPELDVKLRRAR